MYIRRIMHIVWQPVWNSKSCMDSTFLDFHIKQSMTRVTYLECMSIFFRPASPPSLIIPFTPGTEEGPPPHTLGFITLITTQIFIAIQHLLVFIYQQQLEVASAPACFESQPWWTLWGRLAVLNDDFLLTVWQCIPSADYRITANFSNKTYQEISHNVNGL
jgi:hypothetical protein